MSDTRFITHVFKSPLVGNFDIIPFGDVHRDSPNCDVPAWQRFCQYAKERPNALFLGMGDMLDLASWSERRVMRELHESTKETLDGLVRAKADEMLDEVSFMKGRCIGLLTGNHDWTFEDGTTLTDYMAQRLDTVNLDYIAYVIVLAKQRNHRSQGADALVRIFCSHGKYSGKLLGSTFNTVEQMRDVFSDADIYCQGHDHRKGAVPDTTLDAVLCRGKIEVKQRRQWFCRSGSFLKGYEPGKKSYVAAKILAPTDLGTIRLEVTLRRIQEGGQDIILKDIHCWS